MNKKIPKRLLAVAMAAMTAVTVSVPAFAESSIINAPSTNKVQVESSIASGFTVTIPKAVVLTKASGSGTGEYTAAFDATVTGDIGELETVYVTPDASVTLTGDKAGATTVATTTIGTTEFARAAILGKTATGTHNLTAQLTPGAWSGAMNVAISLKEKAAEPQFGDKVTIGDYEYCYGMVRDRYGAWSNPSLYGYSPRDVWGVRVLDKTKSSYGALEASINGKPVTHLDYLFANTTSPTLDLSAVKTDNAVTMKGMFAGAAATSIDMTGFNVSNVTSMESMFDGFKGTTINLSGLNAASLRTAAGMFKNTRLDVLNLTGFTADKMNNVKNMFAGAAFSGVLDLTGLNVSNVMSMEGMFYGTAAQSLNISTWNTSRVTNMVSMFSFSAIPTVDMTGLDVSSVTSMDRMFDSFKGATINLSGLNAAALTSADSMFIGAGATTINLTGFTANSIENAQAMFKETKATALDLSGINMTSILYTSEMLTDTAATVGYAKTQADCDLLNASFGKPAGLTFVVKA